MWAACHLCTLPAVPPWLPMQDVRFPSQPRVQDHNYVLQSDGVPFTERTSANMGSCRRVRCLHAGPGACCWMVISPVCSTAVHLNLAEAAGPRPCMVHSCSSIASVMQAVSAPVAMGSARPDCSAPRLQDSAGRRAARAQVGAQDEGVHQRPGAAVLLGWGAVTTLAWPALGVRTCRGGPAGGTWLTQSRSVQATLWTARTRRARAGPPTTSSARCVWSPRWAPASHLPCSAAASWLPLRPLLQLKWPSLAEVSRPAEPHA